MIVRRSLADYPHDLDLMAELTRRLNAGELAQGVGTLRPEPLGPQDVVAWPSEASILRDLREVGERTLSRGELAVAVLAGGMATRFGGAAKAAVPIRSDPPHPSFLGWQLARIAAHREAGGRIPVVVVVSFATRDAVLEHLDAIGWGGVPEPDRYLVVQSLVPRHGESGPLPDDASVPDALAYSAPGHGEVLTALRRSGTVARLAQRGVRHLMVTNCDNLGAVLDRAGVGAHVEGHAPLTVEVVAREPGDKGGPIARVGDRPVIVEGFRLAPDVDPASFSWFNTNTLWFRLEAVAEPMPLSWFAVQRSISLPDGSTRAVTQTEQLIGQATEHLDARFLGVERGRRFMPIKTRDDLERSRAEIRGRLEDPKSVER